MNPLDTQLIIINDNHDQNKGDQKMKQVGKKLQQDYRKINDCGKTWISKRIQDDWGVLREAYMVKKTHSKITKNGGTEEEYQRNTDYQEY